MNAVGAAGAGEKCAIDHILEAQKKGEISENNVLYLIENINIAGPNLLLSPSNCSGFVVVIDFHLP